MVNSAEFMARLIALFHVPNASSGVQLNLCGLKCPEPLMMLRHSLRALESGQIIFIFATDPSTQRDFVAFCDFIGHKLLHCSEDVLDDKTIYFFEVEKA